MFIEGLPSGTPTDAMANGQLFFAMFFGKSYVQCLIFHGSVKPERAVPSSPIPTGWVPPIICCFINHKIHPSNQKVISTIILATEIRQLSYLGDPILYPSCGPPKHIPATTRDSIDLCSTDTLQGISGVDRDATGTHKPKPEKAWHLWKSKNMF